MLLFKSGTYKFKKSFLKSCIFVCPDTDWLYSVSSSYCLSKDGGISAKKCVSYRFNMTAEDGLFKFTELVSNSTEAAKALYFFLSIWRPAKNLQTKTVLSYRSVNRKSIFWDSTSNCYSVSSNYDAKSMKWAVARIINITKLYVQYVYAGALNEQYFLSLIVWWSAMRIMIRYNLTPLNDSRTPNFDALQWYVSSIVCTKKRSAVFPSQGGMSPTKLSLAGNNLIIPGQEELVSEILAGDGKTANLFLQCEWQIF